MIGLDEYSHLALKYEITGIDPLHKILGLVEESGEVAGKFKKRLRGQDITDEQIAYELGDVLWYLNAIAVNLGYSLESIAVMNLKKLEDRSKRNVLKGEGDNR